MLPSNSMCRNDDIDIKALSKHTAPGINTTTSMPASSIATLPAPPKREFIKSCNAEGKRIINNQMIVVPIPKDCFSSYRKTANILPIIYSSLVSQLKAIARLHHDVSASVSQTQNPTNRLHCVTPLPQFLCPISSLRSSAQTKQHQTS